MTVRDAARLTDTRVVYASSAAVYGHPESVPVHESDPKTPTSTYGIAKLAGDGYARAFADHYGLPTVVLRYFNVYGDRPGGGSDVVSQFLARARRGEPLVVHGDGAQTRDFVHVDDVVRANLRAAVTEDTGVAYNVATGEATSIRELADLVREVTGASSDIVSRSARTGDIDRSSASVARARDRLGFEASVGLEEGIGALADDETTWERVGAEN
jgi:UDP-glucose 4-epimerase